MGLDPSSVVATVITGAVGGALVKLIENIALRRTENAEAEQLFSHLELISPALAAAGLLILAAAIAERRRSASERLPTGYIRPKQAGWIGFVQGRCYRSADSPARAQRFRPGCWLAFPRTRPRRSASHPPSCLRRPSWLAKL